MVVSKYTVTHLYCRIAFLRLSARELNLKRSREFLALDKHTDANECFQRAVTVTAAMCREFQLALGCDRKR